MTYNDQQTVHCERFKQMFLALKTNPSANLTDIAQWLADNLNEVCETLTNAPCRIMDRSSSTYTTIVMIDGKPHAIMEATMPYADFSDDVPDVEKLYAFIPDVRLSQDYSTDAVLKVAVTVDLTKWENMVPLFLYAQARFALYYKDALPSARDRALDNIRAITQYFYPAITIDTLSLASDLGALENEALFVSWCKQAATTPVGVAMPPDLSI